MRQGLHGEGVERMQWEWTHAGDIKSRGMISSLLDSGSASNSTCCCISTAWATDGKVTVKCLSAESIWWMKLCPHWWFALKGYDPLAGEWNYIYSDIPWNSLESVAMAEVSAHVHTFHPCTLQSSHSLIFPFSKLLQHYPRILYGVILLYLQHLLAMSFSPILSWWPHYLKM